MANLDKEETQAKITAFARQRLPFLFVIDASMNRGMVLSPEEAAKEGVLFDFGGISNYTAHPGKKRLVRFKSEPIPYEIYLHAFNNVVSHIHQGDTYLVNLTFPTLVTTDFSLKEIFHSSQAPFKLLVKNEFVVFSPEIFIRIKDNRISSFPMKGTIDAHIPDAEKIIMADEKEIFEHNTIVDLIRNDLAMVSKGVKVKRFRYIDRIQTNRKEILQVSSEITGELPGDYLSRLGEIIFTLLPAGSVTGAPKQKTLEIIRNTESDDRGFYTGICGYFDGTSLNSAVMIRFIEKTEKGLVFRSGGGITALSDAHSEYMELNDKIYVPII